MSPDSEPVHELVTVNHDGKVMQTMFELALRYPRNIGECMDRAISLATLDQETAEACFYSLPRAGSVVTGPSIRLAEIMQNAWGRLQVETGVSGIEGAWLTAYAIATDLERMVRVKQEVRVRITNRRGERFSDDMLVTVSNSAQSKAIRNAIFRVVPGPLVQRVLKEARRVAVGEVATLASRVASALKAIGALGVTEDRVLQVVGRTSKPDITADDLLVLRTLYKQVREDGMDVDEAFPAVVVDKSKADGPVDLQAVLTLTEEAVISRGLYPGAPSPEHAIAQALKDLGGLELSAVRQALADPTKGDEREAIARQVEVVLRKLRATRKRVAGKE